MGVALALDVGHDPVFCLRPYNFIISSQNKNKVVIGQHLSLMPKLLLHMRQQAKSTSRGNYRGTQS